MCGPADTHARAGGKCVLWEPPKNYQDDIRVVMNRVLLDAPSARYLFDELPQKHWVSTESGKFVFGYVMGFAITRKTRLEATRAKFATTLSFPKEAGANWRGNSKSRHFAAALLEHNQVEEAEEGCYLRASTLL